MTADPFYRALADAMTECCAVYEPVHRADRAIGDLRLRDANVPARSFFAEVGDHRIGELLVERAPAWLSSGLFDALCRTWRTGEPMTRQIFSLEVPGREPPRRIIDVSARKLPGALLLCWRPISSARELVSEGGEGETGSRGRPAR